MGNLMVGFICEVEHKTDHILDTVSVSLCIRQDHRGTQSATENAPSFGQTHKGSPGPDYPLVTLNIHLSQTVFTVTPHIFK